MYNMFLCLSNFTSIYIKQQEHGYLILKKGGHFTIHYYSLTFQIPITLLANAAQEVAFNPENTVAYSTIVR